MRGKKARQGAFAVVEVTIAFAIMALLKTIGR